jgi:DNA-binding CsgD family transcriptional regulator
MHLCVKSVSMQELTVLGNNPITFFIIAYINKIESMATVGQHKETYEIIDRRNKVLNGLSEGRSLKDLSDTLGVSLDTVYKDKLAIKKRSVSFISTMGRPALAYYYDQLVSEILYAKKKAKDIIESKDELTTDKLKALNLYLNGITEHRELLKESVSFTKIDVLVEEVETIKRTIIDNTNDNPSYFNQSLESDNDKTIHP